MDSPRIAIVGGGPGGLMLARLLKLQGIQFRLFELDQSALSRTQGGTLDIHSDSGQLALKEGNLFSEFQKYARYDASIVSLLGKDGTLFWTTNVSQAARERPEIDRTNLRKILLESLDDEMITWRKKVVHMEQDDSTSVNGSPTYTVVFDDGDKEGGFELIVGADGAWSKVRQLLTDEKPFYSGVTFVEGQIDNVDAQHPDLANRVGQGLWFQIGDARNLVSQRLGDGSLRTYAMLRVPEDWSTTCDIDWADSDRSKRLLIDNYFSDWEPLAKDFMLRSDGPLIARALYMLPVDLRWKTRPGVTVLGDAAHLMTPFAGVGVNLALTDALDLSHAIRSHFRDNVDWATAIQQYEDKMLARAQAGAKDSYTNLLTFFNDDPADVKERILGEVMGVYSANASGTQNPRPNGCQ